MPSLAWLGAFTGDPVTIGGTLDAVVAADGTVAAPGLQGTVTGSGLAVGVPEAGVFLDSRNPSRHLRGDPSGAR